MFLPTSPRPPSGMMRHAPIGAESRPLRGRVSEETGPLEAGADLRQLVLVRLDHRQPVAADLVASEVECRLDRDRVHLDPQKVVRRLKLLVDRSRAVDVAVAMPSDHLGDLQAPEMGGPQNDPPPAELEEGE